MPDFSPLIVERTRDFTGREWVFTAIDAWLAAQPAARFFLITGEPGSGKTAIAARLAQFSAGHMEPPGNCTHLKREFLSGLYFCSARDHHWINPHTFTETLAGQLAARYAEFATALLAGNQAQEMHFTVRQSVGDVSAGQVIGIHIEHIDFKGVSPEDAFQWAVRKPLEALLHGRPDLQIVILLDSLDEALNYDGKISIASLITGTEYLPAGVRFIVTTSPEVDILRQLRGLSPAPSELPLTHGEADINSDQDIRRYIQDATHSELAMHSKPYIHDTYWSGGTVR